MNQGGDTSDPVRREFDAPFYLEDNVDVAAAGVDPYLHFMMSGWREKRSPNTWFAVEDYLDANPDVRAAEVNAFEHYVLTGRAEGRALDIAFAPNHVRLARSADRPLRLLLVSAHPVLEYDDIGLFEHLGYEVFSLGFYTDSAHPANPSRPPLPDTGWRRDCRAAFSAEGCAEGPSFYWLLTPGFCSRFDLVVVHHHLSFVRLNWPALIGRPVIWRDVGQTRASGEPAISRLRAAGMEVVRWSPV